MRESIGVSVIIPYHKRSPKIFENLEALKKVRHVREILLVSDKLDWDPIEEAVDVVAYHRELLGREVRVVMNAHRKGVSGARNTGIDEASSELMAFIDYDDIYHPERFDRDMDHFKDPDCLLSTCCFNVFDEKEGRMVEEWRMPYEKNVFNPGAGFFNNHSLGVPPLACFTYRRKGMIENRLRFDERLSGSEDTLFKYQSILALGMTASPEIVGLSVLRHNNNTTADIYSLALLGCRLESYHQLSEFFPGIPNAYGYFQRGYKKTLFRYLRKGANPFPVMKHFVRIIRNEVVHAMNP